MRFANRVISFLTGTFFFILGCTIASAQSFSEISSILGINHVHSDIKLINGGVCILDIDNNGLLDIYLTGGDSRDHLYMQTDVVEEVGIAAGFGATANIKTCGVISGDINNDGFMDLFITTDKGHNNLLYLNNGDGTFTDISESAGIVDNVWSTSAVFGDYNLDGFLDIYVTNYVEFEEDFIDRFDNFLTAGLKNFMYVNNGDGTFTESASGLGIDNDGGGLSAVFSDLDNDGDQDLYVVNDFKFDFGSSIFYENQYPENNFIDKTTDSRTGNEFNGMGIAIGDYNEDLWSDIYVTDIISNFLYRNNRNGTFTDKAFDSETRCIGDLFSDNPAGYVSWGAFFFDYDNDTYLDLFVANGNMVPDDFGEQYHPNHLYNGQSNRIYDDVSISSGIAAPSRTRGAVYGDLDNDGDLDMVVSNVDFLPTSTDRTWVFQNNEEGKNWLKVSLRGIRNNFYGLGSKVVVYDGDRHWQREIDGGSSYQSQNSIIAHFGLDEIEEVDSVMVYWLGGHSQVVKNLAVNQLITLTEECFDIENVSETACEEEGFRINDVLITQPGTYEEIIEREGDCDLRRIINLEFEDCIVASIEYEADPIQIFPNPASQYLKISGNISGHSEHRIFNLTGRVVLVGNINQSGHGLDIRQLTSGTYVLQILSKSEVISLNFIKK